MKNKQIPIQKGKSVSFIIAVIFILIVLKTNGQSKFDGIYCVNYTLKDIYTCIKFYENGIFEYTTGGDLGNTFYGNGYYILKNNFLKLDFSETYPKNIGYHKSSFWNNNKDSISIDFNVANVSRKVIGGATVIVLSEKTGSTSDEKGNLTFSLRKTKEDYKFIVSCLGYDSYEFFLDGNYNHQVSVVMQAFQPGIPIKNQIDTLQIVELKADYFMVKEKDGEKTKWTKID